MESTDLLTRSDIAAIEGVGDDVLQFWLRNELLKSEPAEPRKHRRFKSSEARIAKVLAELRNCGANVDALRAMSSALRAGVDAYAESGLPMDGLQDDDDLRISDAFGRYVEAIADDAHRDRAWLGYQLLAGEGFYRLYQDGSGHWVVENVGPIEGLPVKSAIVFDFWQIFDNVRADLKDRHR